MKFECMCGKLVIDSEFTNRYHWMKTSDWWKFLDTVDSEIEKITDPSMAEGAIMKIRYAATAHSVWECDACKRLITLDKGEVIFLSKESGQ